MEEEDEYTPGTKSFWVHFIQKMGKLVEKEDHRCHSRKKEGVSLMDHYEWFLEYDDYEEALMKFLQGAYTWVKKELRVLHVGCGNSNFCDFFPESLLGVKFEGKPVTCDILNVDICENVIEHLVGLFPTRQYVIGDCCNLVLADESSKETSWYHCSGSPPFLRGVHGGSVDLVFDKGTLDALLSAFPGEYNPNAEAYATEALKCLATGGCIFIITINCIDLVNTYLLSASDGDRSFSFKYKTEIFITKDQVGKLHVETLGQRYSCYGYVVTM
ncbi:hypothetical protein STCU_02364 [Strigomonas culicis]|uniref:Methyltransferase type 11 domain-containing protein n=1 Tax=Strigomonas culicis TaxID=28005 RepID=S9UWW8_9TRYP|nr:hypothetical protein STCU_02364 [Strigomonas culicis]|eukprot:EPY33264.1 hypothetical protein STCU_02364 [Strigomonas culicis]